MSSKVFRKQKKKMFSTSLLSVFLCALVLMTGCSSKNASMMPASKYTRGSVGDANLTAKQKEIFYKTGQLDKKLPKSALPAVAEQYSHFLNGGRRTMEVFSQRSEDYIGHARDVFRAQGMPEELAYLAIVESGYKHTAKSHAGAAGTWQFMPYTGKHYGLRQDKWLDERLDPYKSVEAAATYLKRLHSYFDDWLLAVAAYNAGEGKIGRALEATGAKDFFTLAQRNHKLNDKMQLRTETLVYVPRFLAVCKIMRNLGPLGFDKIDHEQDALHARVEVRPNTNLKGLASAAGLSWQEFREINASHKQTVNHSKFTTYVYVPLHAVNDSNRYVASSASRAYVASASKKSSSRTTTSAKSRNYTVKSGESLSVIAHKHGISTAALCSANKLTKSSKIRVGQVLRIPAGGYTAVASAQKAKPTSHKVKSGESLSVIAHKYDTSVAELIRANKLTASSKIRVGQVLQLPGAKKSAVASRSVKSSKKTAPMASYKVKPGESLSGIAHKHGTTVATLMKINNISDASKVRMGQSLKVPAKAVASRVHVVKYGDTVGAIALKYDLTTAQLLKLNNKKSASIREGEKLLVSMR